MQRQDIDAVWDVLIRMFVWAKRAEEPAIRAFLAQRRTPVTAQNLYDQYMALGLGGESHSGGALLGHGGQGCVYAPPLKCAEGYAPIPEGNLVSKYTLRPFAEDETRTLKLLQAIDPQLSYSIYTIHDCAPAIEQTEPVHVCGIAGYNARIPRYILNYPNGGKELFEIWVPRTHWLHYFHSFQNLLDGLVLFHANNVVHMDIKPENMVGKWSPEHGTYWLRFIDFGFAFSTTEPHINPAFGYWSQNYSPWPYELRFLNPEFTEDMITEQSLQEFLHKAYFFHIQTLPISIYNPPTLSFYKELWKRCKEMSYAQRLDFLAKSSDVYSLGRALSFLYVKTTGHTCEAGEASYQIPNSSPGAEFTFQENLRKYVSNRFFSRFIAKLIHIDPFQRPRASEIAGIYVPILRSMHQILNPSVGFAVKKTRRSSRK